MKKWVVGTLVTAVALAGCNLNQVKEAASNMGFSPTIVGAGGGAVLGAWVCDDKDKKKQALCAITGGVIGALVAQELQKVLSEPDIQRVDEETAKVIEEDSARSAPREWSNPETGARGTVAVKSETERRVTEPVPMLKGPLTSPPPLVLVGQQYQVTANSLRVRGGPGSDYAPLGVALSKDQVIDIMAKVEAQPQWLLLARNGVGSGYVHADYLRPTGQIVQARKPDQDAQVQSVQVAMQQRCKTIEQTAVNKEGKKASSESVMCQQPDGSWSIVS